MADQQTVKAFVSGVHNLLPDEVIPKDAASDSLNWITKDAHIELMYGRQLQGAAGAVGKSYGEHVGYKVDGTAVRLRKVNTKIQALVAGTWTDVITGLSNTDYVFANYQSLAGSFIYIFGIDGIYKIVAANPTSYTSLYDATKNFKCYAIIDKGRTIAWNIDKDPNGFRYSWIDNQRGVSGSTGVYTAVTGEATASLGGTLAFKGGGASRTAFGVTITLTVSGEIYTDNYLGVLTGSLGGTGTINYTSGVYTLSNAGVGTVAYQWENSNLRGVTDFSYSATRLAGEGNVLRQDYNGTAIKTVIPLDGVYFSLKGDSAYQVTLDSTDTSPTNEIYRTDIGISSLRSAVGTGKGIIFINTANSSKPKLEILQRNITGDNFENVELFPQFAFGDYDYSDALVDFWDRFVVIGCKEESDENNRLLLGSIKDNTVDITYYGIRTSAKTNGMLYGGDPVSQSTYELFSGFDDIGIAISNLWDGNGETYDADTLKKVKKLRLRGKIDPAQAIQVYLAPDDGDYQLVGTILGSGDYVNYGDTFAIGSSFVGSSSIGGGDAVNVYSYFIEIKIHFPKFRKRKVRFVATGVGYASVEMLTDFDVWEYQEKMPARFRIKQNVDLAGTPVDEASPDY